MVEHELVDIVSSVQTLLDVIKIYRNIHNQRSLTIEVNGYQIRCGLFQSNIDIIVDNPKSDRIKLAYDDLVTASKHIDVIYHVAKHVVHELQHIIDNYEHSVKILKKWIVVEEL